MARSGLPGGYAPVMSVRRTVLPAGAPLDGLLGTVQPDGSTAVLVITVVRTADQLPVVGPEFGAVFASVSAA